MRFLFFLGVCVGLMGCSRTESSNDLRRVDAAKVVDGASVSNEPAVIRTNATMDQRAMADGINNTRQNSGLQTDLKDQSTNSADLFTVVIDARSGQYAAVSGDGHVIALKDKSGNLIWTNDIIAKFGTNLPIYSNGKIVSLGFIEGQIVIYVGKESIWIEPKSGRILRTDVR